MTKTLTKESKEAIPRTPDEVRAGLAGMLQRREEHRRGDRWQALECFRESLNIVTGKAEGRLCELNDDELDSLDDALKVLGRDLKFFETAVEVVLVNEQNAQYRGAVGQANLAKLIEAASAANIAFGDARAALPVLQQRAAQADAIHMGFVRQMGVANRLVSLNALIFAEGAAAFEGENRLLSSEQAEQPTRIGMGI